MSEKTIGKILVIKENYGRLGNNIFQLICCLELLSKNNSELDLELDLLNSNSRFKLFLFDFQKIQSIHQSLEYKNKKLQYNQNKKTILEVKNFFEDHNNCPSYKIVSQIIDTYLKPSINWNYLKYKARLPIIDWTKTLLIHFRSGDIFYPQSIGRSHPYYSQPPWGFYLKIFEDYYQKYPIFLLMAEDKANPLIDKILELNNSQLWQNRNVQFIYYSNDLGTDIRTFLDAPQVVISNSTFAYSLMALKPNLDKSLIIACFQTTFLLCDCPRIIYYHLMDDYPSFNQWEYTLEQRELMLSFPPEKVVKSKTIWLAGMHSF